MSLFFAAQRPAAPAPAPAEQRSISYQDVWGSGGDVDVFPSGSVGALTLIPLFAAHRTIIDAVAATPLHAYRKTSSGVPRRISPTPPLLGSPPYGRTPFAWKAQCVSSLVSDGNAFGLVTSLGPDGWPSSLMWLPPQRVTVADDRAEVEPVWAFDGREIPRDSLVHIPWVVPAGKVRGLSPLKAFMTALEMGQAAQRMGRDWFVNGAMPSGHLKSVDLLADGDAEAAKVKWKAAIQGRDVFVSGADWSFDTIGVPADEARFIETLRLSATQVASIYGIPAEEIGGESGSSMTYATVEGNELRFARRVVRPWAVRIEEALSLAMNRSSYAEFDLDAIVRADLLTRMEAHAVALKNGLETQDEGRLAENREPLTPEQKTEWLNTYGRGSATPAPAPSANPIGAKA